MSIQDLSDDELMALLGQSRAIPDTRALATASAEKHGVPVDLVLRTMRQESGGRVDARSPKGALGPMQLMPGTARELGVDPNDPAQNIDGGVRYLKQQLDRFGDPRLALAAYNAGPGAVAKYGGVPPYAETQDYVRRIAGDEAPQGDLTQLSDDELMAMLQPPAPSGAGAASNPDDDQMMTQLQKAFEPQVRDFNGNLISLSEAKASGGYLERDPKTGEDVIVITRTGSQLDEADAEKARALSDARANAEKVGSRDYNRDMAASSGATFGFIDEIDSLSKAGNVGLRNLIGTDVSGAGRPGYGAMEAYRAAMQVDKERRQAYEAEHPVENVALQIGGGLLTGGAGTGMIRNAPTIGSAVARSAAVGGGYGALAGAGMADGGAIPRLKGAVVGGGTGAAFGGGLTGVGRGLGVSAATAAAQPPSAARLLATQGVQLTPGQMFGGIAQRAEDAATSIPILGDSIRGARIRGVESFNQAALARVLAPIGQALPAGTNVGRDGLRQATQTISQAYDAALSPVTVMPDAQLANDFAQVAARPNLPEALRGELTTVLGDVAQRAGGPIDGNAWKVIDADLGAAIRAADNASANQPSQRLLRDALTDTRESWRNLLERTDPAARAAVAQADEATANLARVRQASQMTGAREGVFSPANLNNAVRATDSSAGNRAFAQGDALMQDLTDAGMAVLPSTVPDSGTPFRSLMATAGLSGGGVAIGADPATVIGGLVGLTGAAGVYSAPVQRTVNQVFQALTPGAKRQALARLSSMAGENPALRPVEAAVREQLIDLAIGREQ